MCSSDLQLFAHVVTDPDELLRLLNIDADEKLFAERPERSVPFVMAMDTIRKRLVFFATEQDM